jgi:predicted acylesterase/phospholipase RssA
MSERLFTREAFLTATAALGATGVVPNSALPASAELDPDHPNRFDRALVLSGGGARGAYEGGIIDYLVQAGNIREGQPLAPYGVVCGTSIGALNGYFVATAQYKRLRELWYTIASRHAVRLKPQYAKIVNPDSGVGNRVGEAIGLGVGFATDVMGVLDGDHLQEFLAEFIDPSRPVVMPFAWTVTNLTRSSAEYFYLLPNQPKDQALAARAQAAVRATVGPSAVIRPASPDILVSSLRASAALPLAFDPVLLPAADGSGPQQYCDGGVTENTPIGIARAAARNVDVIMMDPPFESSHYKNGVELGLGAFGTTQRALLEANVRSAYFESLTKRTLKTLRPTPEINRVAALLFASDFYLIRPRDVLSVSVGGFNDADKLFDTYKTGFADAARGFTRYDFDQAQLQA